MRVFARQLMQMSKNVYENREIALQDEAKKVILSTKGTMDDVSDEMRDFLKYVQSSTVDMAAVEQCIKEGLLWTFYETIRGR